MLFSLLFAELDDEEIVAEAPSTVTVGEDLLQQGEKKIPAA